MKNIIFIGGSYSGKTTISKKLAEQLPSYQYISIDDTISVQEQLSITDIFKIFGESYFRKCETNILKTLRANNNLIIDCGGGILTTKDNINIIKQLGTIIWLERDLSTIEIDDSRPLINNVKDLIQLNKQRNKTYSQICDLKINNNSIDDTIKTIRKELTL